jgi:hypothetical protein
MLYDGYFHELLNDIGKDVVIADVTNWIGTRLPATRGASNSASGTFSLPRHEELTC